MNILNEIAEHSHLTYGEIYNRLYGDVSFKDLNRPPQLTPESNVDDIAYMTYYIERMRESMYSHPEDWHY